MLIISAVSKSSIMAGIFQAMYQVSVLLILNFRGVSLLALRDEPNRPAIKVKNSLIFNAFVLCQVSSSRHQLMGNYKALSSVAGHYISYLIFSIYTLIGNQIIEQRKLLCLFKDGNYRLYCD